MTIDHKTEQTLAEIAKKELGIETLETRRNGSLDFHELGRLERSQRADCSVRTRPSIRH